MHILQLLQMSVSTLLFIPNLVWCPLSYNLLFCLAVLCSSFDECVCTVMFYEFALPGEPTENYSIFIERHYSWIEIFWLAGDINLTLHSFGFYGSEIKQAAISISIFAIVTGCLTSKSLGMLESGEYRRYVHLLGYWWLIINGSEYL
jgi:hypothetical protein